MTITDATAVDPAALRRAVEAVTDPELPPLTIRMLGMLHTLRCDDTGHVRVELLPTFSGCPATDVIGGEVERAVRRVGGVTGVTVRFLFDPPWTPDRIDEAGRAALRAFGITPPGEVVRSVALDGVRDRHRLPLAGEAVAPRVCPYCGSGDTQTDTVFGPTPCRSIHFCRGCRQPFEAFKDL
ncbi:MAG TPA: 1,2-phenylacetyl-CoA epoxidase subunit PaaD [Nitriliruptorales bacterium]|nr:1,2-phenylacetyl-CoA epoxidase subunit PaaD [Nitriliruptorales bacterium]